jgi:transcriptional regulator EpsA
VRLDRAWSAEPGAARRAAPKAFQLTAEESARFLQIVSDSALITRHYDLNLWLNGEIQQFLPHEILLAAWGDFSTGPLKLDITSALPGVRTAGLAHCRLDDLVRDAYAQWTGAGRRPVLSSMVAPSAECACSLHAALRGMRSVMLHGVRDQRSGHESLYLAFSYGSLTKGGCKQRFVSVVDALIAQIDGAFRKIETLVLHDEPAPRLGRTLLDLSPRERQIIESVCEGMTNVDIAIALDISPFTVKNHVQRIFRKLGVTNRTQAAARYAEAMRQAALENAAPPGRGEQG